MIRNYVRSMPNNRWLTVLTPFLLMVFLAGCSSSPTVDPSEQLTRVTFSLFAGKDVNAGESGVASPVEIQVYELVDDSMLMSADFDMINKDYEEALKNNFIKTYDYVLTPGQFKFVGDFEIDPDTNYIGVVAKFAEPDSSDWKKAVKILNRGRIYHLLMYFSGYEIKLEKVE